MNKCFLLIILVISSCSTKSKVITRGKESRDSTVHIEGNIKNHILGDIDVSDVFIGDTSSEDDITVILTEMEGLYDSTGGVIKVKQTEIRKSKKTSSNKQLLNSEKTSFKDTSTAVVGIDSKTKERTSQDIKDTKELVNHVKLWRGWLAIVVIIIVGAVYWRVRVK